MTRPLALLVATLPLVAQTFPLAIRPVLAQNCSGCHNAKLSSGNLNLASFLAPTSLTTARDGWERIAAKVKSGGMPPLPDATKQAFVAFLENEFDRADKLAKPDPGRVTARRLNRAEYANTIRDLLGVEFNAQEEFPPDDSGYGFDNISDVLTVSPVLMQRYLTAAERIASRAVGADPLTAAALNGPASLARLLAIWPAEVISCDKAAGDAVLFPADSLEKDFAWAPAHPVADAYRAFQSMPYDANTSDLAAVLFAIHPDSPCFEFSEPEPLAAGKYRRIKAVEAKKADLLKTYTELASAKPPGPPQRSRPPAAKPPPAKPATR